MSKKGKAKEDLNKVVELPDETSLTKTDKLHIQTTWNVNFKKDMMIHGCEIFIRLFQKYPDYMHFFHFPPNPTGQTELMKNKAFQAHCLTVMVAINTLIEEGFKDAPLFVSLVNRIARTHFRLKVTSVPVEHLCEIIYDYVNEINGKKGNRPDIEESWRKFLSVIFETFLKELTI